MARSLREDIEHELVTLGLVIAGKAVQCGGQGKSALVLGGCNTKVRALIVRRRRRAAKDQASADLGSSPSLHIQ